MSRRHYNLPSLTTLGAFEAAARHSSFKTAAQELSVTPGAVSHQIKTLEVEIGTALFLRNHRGVVLTGEGESLFQVLSGSFAKIAQCLQGIRDGHSADTVTIGCTSAVATLWIVPAVLSFWREHPGIRVNQVVQDRPFWSAAELDLFIRYGRDRNARLDHQELYQDVLVPVGNQEMADRLDGAGIDVLARERLIWLDSEDRTWTSWSDWFRQLGHDRPLTNGIRVNNYSIALQTAQDGAGLALGWQRLVRPLLRSGQLVQIGPYSLPAPHRFHVVSRPQAELSEGARLLRDWIVAGTGETSGEVSQTKP